jgi:glycosyltransferase involved in cell wall biosynthesis
MISSRCKGKPAVLCVGVDLSSHGGIASVVKCHYEQWERGPRDVDYHLLKTSYYEDRSRMWEPLLFLRALARLIWNLLTINVALVHVHTGAPWSFLRKSVVVCVARLFRKRVILHIHASRFEEWWLPDSRIRAAHIGFILRRCSLVIVLCRDWEQKLRRRYPAVRIRVLPNPSSVSTTPASRASRQGIFTVLFLGFLIPSKGVRDLLAVAQKMASENLCETRMVVAGKGPLQQEIVDFVREKDLGPWVQFVGWVTGPEKARLLSSASLLFLPSYHEGMPMAILEAMSYGLPILSTRIAGIPDLVQEGRNGYLCEPGDVEGYLRVIRTLCHNRDLVDELGQKSLEYAQQFTSAVIYRQLESIYAEISEGQIPPRAGEGGQGSLPHGATHATA